MTERKTTLINIWAGPGAGKSTTAAGVFERLKRRNISCELVREYVKAWAWRGEKIGEFDDLYITAKQLRAESTLYGRVDYIITDAPIGLGAVYEEMYRPSSRVMLDVCGALRTRQLAAGIKIVDVFLVRDKPYSQAGRWEDETAARKVDAIVRRHLAMVGDYHTASNTEDILEIAGVPL